MHKVRTDKIDLLRVGRRLSRSYLDGTGRGSSPDSSRHGLLEMARLIEIVPSWMSTVGQPDEFIQPVTMIGSCLAFAICGKYRVKIET